MQVCGITVHVNAKGMVRDITVGGRTLDKTRMYRISTIGFLIHGGDGYGFLRRYGPKNTGVLLRDALDDFVKKHSPLGWPPQGRWRFDSGL